MNERVLESANKPLAGILRENMRTASMPELLSSYIPHSGDIVLFRPKSFKEKLIAKLLRSDYCHVGMIDVNRGKPPLLMEQNIDLAREEEQPLSNYLKHYDLLILRCPYLTRWTREKMARIFKRFRSARYSYCDAFLAWCNRNERYPSRYILLNRQDQSYVVARIYRIQDQFFVQLRNRYTCAAAVGLALYFGLENSIDSNTLFDDKCLWYLVPNDFLESQHFAVLGLINKDTKIDLYGGGNLD